MRRRLGFSTATGSQWLLPLRFFAALICGLLWGNLALGGGAVKPKSAIAGPGGKGGPKRTIFTVYSNVATAQITSDGIIRGKAGQAFEVDPGPLEITLEAPGYIKRGFTVTALAGRDNKVKINLIRQFKNVKVPVMKLANAEDSEAVINEESLCVRLDATLPSRGDPGTACRLRKNWLEDIRFAGIDEEAYGAPSIFFQQAQRDQFAQLQKFFLTQLPDAAWLQKADLLRAEVPDYAPVSALEAWGFLIVGQCKRVGEIWQDAMFHGSGQPAAYSVQVALCKELSGDRVGALQMLRQPMQGKGQAPRIAYFYYHLARLEMSEWLATASSQTQIERKRAIAQFEPILGQCLRLFPRYYPCLDLYRMSLLAQEKREDVRKIYLPLFGLSSMQPMKLLDADVKQQLSPRDFQLLWESLQQDYADHRDVQLAFYVAEKKAGHTVNLEQAIGSIENARVGDYATSLALTRQLLEVREIPLATRVFQLLLQEDPKRDHVRWHLISLARARKDYQTCALLGQEIPLSFSNDVVASFRKLQGDCLLRLKKYKEAAELFEVLMQDDKSDWSAGYHAALACEKLGDMARAEETVNWALGKNPPNQFRFKMQKMLERYRSGKTE